MAAGGVPSGAEQPDPVLPRKLSKDNDRRWKKGEPDDKASFSSVKRELEIFLPRYAFDYLVRDPETEVDESSASRIRSLPLPSEDLAKEDYFLCHLLYPRRIFLA
ncbi:hypothetical protein KM043_010607 [Ampulex compressa]|nr:hypothetical protein KM043_010607 [Ampulex compressa]